MKKTVLTTVVLTLLLATGAAFAQPGPPPSGPTVLGTNGHGVSVGIPSMAFIRMTSGGGVADVAAPTTVEFSWTAAAFASLGDGTYAPTNAGAFNWDDVQVRYNGGGDWQVAVSTSPLESTLDDDGFDWSKVAMTPAGTGVSPFDLGADAVIVDTSGNTTGWRSLGIDPADYRVALDGTESTGTYAATVTFTLQNP